MSKDNEVVAKIAKEIREKVEDSSRLAEEAFYNASPFNHFPSMITASHSHRLLEGAREALEHNNKEEAAHQLRREVDFCKKAPKLANGVYEKTGEAGLKALNEQKNSLEIIRTMESTWKKNWALDTTAFGDNF